MRRPVRHLMILLLSLVMAGKGVGQQLEIPEGTPQELLQKGNAAYMARDWPEAARVFQAFLDTYGSEAALAEAVTQVKPLLTLARIRLGEFGAAGELISECLTFPRLEPVLKDELSFWKGIILLKVEAHEEARAAFLAYFQTPEFNALRKVEAILLYGTTFVLEGKPEEAAAFFEQQSARLWELNRETALRAQTLRLHCLLETGQREKALDLVRTLQPYMMEVTQLVSLHSLMAQLGGMLLEEGEFYPAIYCLQRVWAADRLMRHQAGRIRALNMEIESLLARPGTEPLVFQKRSVLTRVEREHKNFSADTDFDLGVRMRLGFAWLGLERWREAALVLEDALNLPGEPGQQAQAGMAVVQCWLTLERLDRCIAMADSWLLRFAGKAEADSEVKVRFLMAQARHEDEQYQTAAAEFEALSKAHPKHELAPQALFMAGMGRLMADDYPEAMRIFQEVRRVHDQQPVAEDADYWWGMALSFDKEYAACREHLAAHLKKHGKAARYHAQAVFRRAYCLYALGDYEGALKEFAAYARDFPDGPDLAESRILTGDIYCSISEIDRGLESYRAVSPDAGRWHDEAHFKTGNVLKLRKDWDGLRAHHQAYIAAKPESKRLPEAVYWAGHASIAQERLDEAREQYWQALITYGDKAGHHGIEDILLALPRLYRGETGRVELLREIQRRRAEADKAGQKTLVSRLHWMEGHMQPADKPRLAQADFMMAASLLDVEKQNPRVIADCADASFAAGSKSRARELYTDLIRWHPRAVEVDRALAGLGFLAAEAGDALEALAWFERFEKRVSTMTLRPRVLMKKAELLASGKKPDQAVEVYKALLEDKLTPARAKAEALLAWAALWEKQGQVLKATALYERVYLSYGRSRDLVAQAYLARGKALEKLGKKLEAAEVYDELVKTEMLRDYPEHAEAAKRLQPLQPLLDEARLRQAEAEKEKEVKP
ncbi:MAG TPA: tetratricopeptide repeat protein [Prosthecobacter sp.]|nr:tetratricopeptide repeat protein [Prosthecobacter sp.]HRK13455.1 tetratricopeptide repeat protein [Prosthecobacter sp.]